MGALVLYLPLGSGTYSPESLPVRGLIHVRSTQGVNCLQQGLQIPVVWTSTFLNLPYVQEQAANSLSVKCILG